MIQTYGYIILKILNLCGKTLLLTLCFLHIGKFWLTVLSLPNSFTFKRRFRKGQSLDQKKDIRNMLFLEKPRPKKGWLFRITGPSWLFSNQSPTSPTHKSSLDLSLQSFEKSLFFLKFIKLSSATTSLVCSPENK